MGCPEHSLRACALQLLGTAADLAPDPLPAGMCSDLENFWKTQVRLLLTVGRWDVEAPASGLSWFFVVLGAGV